MIFIKFDLSYCRIFLFLLSLYTRCRLTNCVTQCAKIIVGLIANTRTIFRKRLQTFFSYPCVFCIFNVVFLFLYEHSLPPAKRNSFPWDEEQQVTIFCLLVGLLHCRKRKLDWRAVWLRKRSLFTCHLAHCGTSFLRHDVIRKRLFPTTKHLRKTNKNSSRDHSADSNRTTYVNKCSCFHLRHLLKLLPVPVIDPVAGTGWCVLIQSISLTGL